MLCSFDGRQIRVDKASNANPGLSGTPNRGGRGSFGGSSNVGFGKMFDNCYNVVADRSNQHKHVATMAEDEEEEVKRTQTVTDHEIDSYRICSSGVSTAAISYWWLRR